MVRIVGTDLFNEKGVTYFSNQDILTKLDFVTIQAEDILESKYAGVRTTASAVAPSKNGNLFLRKIRKIIFRPKFIFRSYHLTKRVLPRLIIFICKPNYINFEAFAISALIFIVVSYIFSIIFRIILRIIIYPILLIFWSRLPSRLYTEYVYNKTYN
jgi:hypothetical protein